MKEDQRNRKFNQRRFFKVAGIICVGLVPALFLFNPSGAMAQNVFKVGISLPLTGVFAREAEDIKLGAIMAADEWNVKGGVLGRKVELIIRDDQLNPAEGARKVKEMVEQEGVKFVAGALSAAVAMGIHSYTKRVGVLYVCTTIPDDISKVPDYSKYSFHDMAGNYMYTQTLGNYIFDHNLGKKLYVLYADYAFGHQGIANITKLAKSRGGEIIGEARHPLGTSDYSAFFPKILAAKPDMLYIVNYGKDQINTLKQAYDYGIHQKMRIATLLTPETMAKETGAKAFEGVYSSTIFYWELENSIPEAKIFVEKFRKRTGIPPTFEVATGYSAVMEILDGVKRAGTDDVEQVIKAMEGHEYNHYKGIQKWRKCDHQSIQDMWVYVGKKPSEITREWDLFKILGKAGGEAIVKTCKELGHE
jgi:branched-chain amino acid transport system substrate-binding protein